MLIKILGMRGLRWVASVVAIFALVGCSTVGTYVGGADELPAKIRAQQLISKGDHVEIRTVDGTEHRFNVKHVDSELVRGTNDSVRIDDIASLKVTSPKWAETVFIPTAILVLLLLMGFGR